jgi:indolepyruvate ferredoxin oxidoreductase alpha subunit
MSRLLSGNQAIAYAALEEGVALVTGYPGTPSTEALTEIEHLARRGEPSPYVEWSVNEKVAFELAAGAAWAGKRALVTMKMSGANVALDALIGVAHSGVNGGLVVYVADDPGVEAGMPEQDSRLLAQLCGLPLLDPSDPAAAYRLTRYAVGGDRAAGNPALRDLGGARPRAGGLHPALAAAGPAGHPQPRHHPLHQGRFGHLPSAAPGEPGWIGEG